MKANNTRTKQSKENRKTHNMLNTNKLTKTKPKPYVCVRVCVSLCTTVVHSTEQLR